MSSIRSVVDTLFRLWMALGHAMGAVQSRVILTLIFFGIITPVAIVRRLLLGDWFGTRPSPAATSYFHRTPESPTDMKRVF